MTRVCLLALVACSSPSKMPDAASNGDGVCGTDDLYTGEIVDWDSTTDTFCGVLGANLAVDGDPTETASTANHPNGRFQLCLKPADQTVVTITPPTDTSECAPAAGLYQLGGMAIATHAVIATGQLNSLRMIGMTRAAAFFPQFGSGLDDTKAIVFVHVDGTPGTVISSAAHDTPVAFDGSAWGSGDTGIYVAFPNTDVSTGSSTVNFADGNGIGGGTVPVAAHQFTYLNLVAQ
ncbi:MAG TPA: hypothetical protein VGL61_35720 [Kofleriaceae bacterium]